MTHTYEPPTEDRLKEIENLLATKSSISFHSPRAQESMMILLSEAQAARKLREEVESMEEDVEFLRALEAAGVDSWSGRDVAVEIHNEWRSEE